MSCGGRGSLFPVLVAVLEVLLLRYLGSEEIAVAGRNGANSAVSLQIGLSDDPPFLDLLERVCDALQADGRDAGASALLILDGAPMEADSARYDLIFSLNDALVGTCEHNADQFDSEQARALTRHFVALATEAATRPAARISTFEMLDAEEKHRILIEWNGEQGSYPPFCVHEFFEQQVERTPDAVAAVFRESQLTYRELNSRANQLAHYLRAKGAGPEALVGLLMDASLNMIIAVVAILKAGGAYLALDHNQPAHLLRELIREAGVSLAVTTASNSACEALEGQMEFVCVDRDASRIAAESHSNPRSGVTPGNVLLIRYTSGSTGKPKGVVIIHRAMTSRLIPPPPGIAPTDVCLLNPAWGFGTRLFYPLALGATVVVVTEEEARNPGRLADNLNRHGITSIFMVPSHLRQLLDSPDVASRLTRLRSVTVGGETLTPHLMARFKEVLPHAQLLNAYGGAEIGGTAAVQEIIGKEAGAVNSIGRPILNTRIYLLDRDRNLVPPGAVGEMYVGSGHLARGYLHRPDLTALRFVPDPFSGQDNFNDESRLYRTGDLGRHLPDGRIEYLGRVDRQVKIRGYRVELEGIEAVLQDHERVDQAVVTTQKMTGGDRLVACIVAKREADLSVSALQKFLRERLPDYMIPAAFVFLDRVALNRHGKIDMQRLPAPGPERPQVDSRWEAPRNPLEAEIAEIWSSVLGLAAVGIHDNFIDLGGDSLLATRVSARLQRQLNIDLPMDLILEWTIATIAAEAMAAEGSASG